MDGIQFKLCDIQGRLFELSGAKGYDSATFIKAFMTSETACSGLARSTFLQRWSIPPS